MSEDAEIRALADRAAIQDVLMRFSRGLDRLDEALLASCFHEDSYDDHGHFKGTGAEFAAFIVPSLRKRADHTMHSICNVLIELDALDSDLARVETYVVAYLKRTDDDGEPVIDVFGGRYMDRFARRDGEWRIARRVVVHDWSTSIEAVAGFPLPMSGFTEGRRDRGDAVYLP